MPDFRDSTIYINSLTKRDLGMLSEHYGYETADELADHVLKEYLSRQPGMERLRELRKQAREQWKKEYPPNEKVPG